jgi:Berberine and berberine like
VRNYWSALVEHAVGMGSYVNFMTDYDEERVRSAYVEKYARLEQIKAIYDPTNVFHLNVNIKPSAQPRGRERDEGFEMRKRRHPTRTYAPSGHLV